jgi:hypothetical protein
MHTKKNFVLTYNVTANEYCLRFEDPTSDREHIFDSFNDVRYFLKSLGYTD